MPHDVFGEDGFVVRSFPFTFDTPGLITPGLTIYTPSPNEVIYDMWLGVETIFDGTTPLVGLTLPPNLTSFVAFDATFADDSTDYPGLVISNGTNRYAHNLGQILRVTSGPLILSVSSNGSIGGPDPGASQGSCVFYLATASIA